MPIINPLFLRKRQRSRLDRPSSANTMRRVLEIIADDTAIDRNDPWLDESEAERRVRSNRDAYYEKKRRERVRSRSLIDFTAFESRGKENGSSSRRPASKHNLAVRSHTHQSKRSRPRLWGPYGTPSDHDDQAYYRKASLNAPEGASNSSTTAADICQKSICKKASSTESTSSSCTTTADACRKSRGVRNNNPGNIQHNEAIQWEGLKGFDKNGFCIFDTMHNGVRAATINVLNAQLIHNRKNIRKIIEKYAPKEHGNNVKAYIDHISGELEIGPEQHIELIEHLFCLKRMMETIFKHELGSGVFKTCVGKEDFKSGFTDAIHHIIRTNPSVGKIDQSLIDCLFKEKPQCQDVKK